MSTDRHDELGAIATDDRWIDDLVAGRHDADDPLAAALASWSDDVQRPVEPAPVPVAAPAASSVRSRRPRGIRLVGLVASLGLIFSSGVGQAVAEDPAAPIKFVLDRGVDLGERLVGEPPSQVEGAPASRVDPGTSRNGTERPPLDDLSAEPTGEGPRPQRPSVIAPTQRPLGGARATTPPRAEVGPAQSGAAATAEPAPSPSAGPSTTPEPTTRPPSAQTTPSPTPTPSLLPLPTRRPIKGPKPPWFFQPTPSPTPTQPGEPGGDATSPTPDPEGTPSPSATSPAPTADDGSAATVAP